MIIGSFAYDKAKDVYAGGILSLNFQIEGVTFIPNVRSTDKEPDYRVIAETSNGDIELGAAWRRTSDKGNDFVSVSLDGPLLSRPFNAALFLDGEGTSASLVWNRIRAQRTGQAKTQANISEAAIQGS
ncbi:DUF736 domain-containing protein [Hyphomicrobium sp.]|uniref:DUF736 domain-containing protein n=1 Tax=Hyphomicrobium sp. TaxID=82 RepID=UPI003561B56B